MNLFPNEELSFEQPGNSSESQLSDDEINQKYIAGEVRIVTEQARYPLTAIVGMINSGDYEISPDFQRRYRWTPERQSRLIESFIMNVPIPPIFLYEDRFSHYQVMDGLQRLTAIYEFYTDNLTLTELEQWPELNGRTYSELPEQLKRGVDRRYLSSIILMQETAKTEFQAQELKQLVFERINSGGVKLEPQEARNAIHNGPLNSLCIRLARNPHFCRAWRIPEPTDVELSTNEVSEDVAGTERYRRMQDVELVLRFFANRQRRRLESGTFKEYLDAYLHFGNLMPEDALRSLGELFTQTIELVVNTFGDNAFYLWRLRGDRWGYHSRPTTVVYDPMMYVFSQHVTDSDRILERKEAFRTGREQFYESHRPNFDGRYTDISNFLERNELFEDFVSKVLE